MWSLVLLQRLGIFSNDPLIGSWKENKGSYTLRKEQPHKWVGHHILTQNLKALKLWIVSLICCSTFTFQSKMRLLTHLTLVTTITPPPSSESFSSSDYALIMLPLKRKIFHPCTLTSTTIGSPSKAHAAWTPLVRKLSIQGVGWTLRRTRLWYHCWIMTATQMIIYIGPRASTQVSWTPYPNPKP